MKYDLLLTGRPGTGKTSLIKQAAAEMKGTAGGFYTEEILDHGVRAGFRLVTLAGEAATLAHVNIRSPHRVGKYGVDVNAMVQVGVPAIRRAGQQDDLIIIDEIGKMELFSVEFRDTVSNLIEGSKRILGTIMLNPNPWADTIKCHPEVELVTVTRTSHPQVQEIIQRWLKAQG
jgi:nucleoside-triphosphatase